MGQRKDDFRHHAFRLIGSQQPQLLASGEALREVTKYAITLSEAAGIDRAPGPDSRDRVRLDAPGSGEVLPEGSPLPGHP